MIDINSKNFKQYLPLVSRADSGIKEDAGLIIGERYKVPDFLGGASVCKVDDFIVKNEDNPRQWTKIGRPLLEALSFQIGADAQFKVVSGSHDKAKLELLQTVGLHHSINWWTTASYNNSNKPFFRTNAQDSTVEDIKILTLEEILD